MLSSAASTGVPRISSCRIQPCEDLAAALPHPYTDGTTLGLRFLHAVLYIHARGIGIGESHDEFRNAVGDGSASWLLPGRLRSVVFRGGGGR